MDIDEQIDKCKIYSKSVEKFDAELKEINELISSIPAEIIDIVAVLKEIKNKEGTKAKILKEDLQLHASIKESQEFLKNYEEILGGYDIARLLDLKSQHNKILEEKRQISNQVSQIKTKIKSQEKKLKLLDGIPCGDKFKSCKFICDANKAKDDLPLTREELKNLKADMVQASLQANFLNLDNIDLQIDKYNQYVEIKQTTERSLEKNKMMLGQNKSKVELLKNQVNSLKEKQNQYEDNREAIENKETLFKEKIALEKKKEKTKKQLDNCKKLEQEYLIEEATAKQAIRSLHEEKNEFKEIQEEWVAYDAFINCMHPNGISYEIIQQKLPVINGEIAKILANIVDFEVFFENDAKKLEIYIKHPNYGKRPLSMGSGAEKTIASMAIRLAMIAITNLPKSELFILDEPATALDQEHMEGFVRLLGMIKNQFKTVLLISHLDHLKDVVDMTIDIDKIDGYAKVNI
jgi:exonuclease SbcC